MASVHSIKSFPADIDRNRFGDWLSGFTDGEGCFTLEQDKPVRGSLRFVVLHASFTINLRADDLPILELVQQFFSCGRIRYRTKGHVNPMTAYRVRKINDLHDAICDHFLTHPLRAKKRLEFDLWRQGIEILHRGHARPRKSAGYLRGTVSRWTEEERMEFNRLFTELRLQHRYNGGVKLE